MPTDWTIFESRVALQIKTKFNGNPRYMTEAENFNKKSPEQSTESSTMLNNEYNENEEIKSTESLVFDELLPASETEEMVEKVWLTKYFFRVILDIYYIMISILF